jgi:FAD/FMN-containing dehydrogenase
VAYPESGDEVRTLLAYAQRHNVALIPRAAAPAWSAI